MTLVGAGLAALGLVLVLDLLSGADLSVAGVLWALGAMVGCATYFIINGDDTTACRRSSWPPADWWSARSPSALLGARRACCRCTRRRPRRRTPAPTFAWWQPLVVLAVVTAALSYVTGVAAARLLGSRLASFVALTEVVAGVLWAWLLLDELPRAGPARRRPADPGRRGRRSSSASAPSRPRNTSPPECNISALPGVSCAWMWS